jgi:hypothetical protein
MSHFLTDFTITPTTWFYLAFLLVVAVYFKFTRLWALRNLDLLALLCLMPGWLLLEYAGGVDETETAQYVTAGFVWLIAGSGWWLLRMLLDPLLRRRPLLEPNMSPGGLTVVGVAVLGSFVVHILTYPISVADLMPAQPVEATLAPAGEADPSQSTSVVDEPEDVTEQGGDSEEPAEVEVVVGPGRQLFALIGVPTGDALTDSGAQLVGTAAQPERESETFQFTARSVLILGHCAIVIGLVLAAYCHFGKLVTGVGVAVLYLLLPYTAYHMERIDQIVLGALLVWAVAAYRYPVITGVLLALAGGIFYVPVFLLPLWTAFYWKYGIRRFWIAAGATFVVLLVAGAMTGSLAETAAHLQWVGGELVRHVWRIPVFVTYLVLCGSLVLGPQPKNLGTLIAHSAVVLLGTAFWYMPQTGGYILWYLPLVLLVVFRPNLKGRVVVPAGMGNGEVEPRDTRIAAVA